MLHGWTEYDAVAMERKMFNAALDANGTRPEIVAVTLGNLVRTTIATALMALAARLAPPATVEKTRYTNAAHA